MPVGGNETQVDNLDYYISGSGLYCVLKVLVGIRVKNAGPKACRVLPIIVNFEYNIACAPA
jgi:hypothetical protein